MSSKIDPFFFNCYPHCSGTTLAAAMAEALSAGLNAQQINVLASFLNAVSSIMSYIAAQVDFNETLCDILNGTDKKDKDAGSDSNNAKSAVDQGTGPTGPAPREGPEASDSGSME